MSVGKGSRGEYAKTAGRKREIVQAGLEVFASSGFRSGSIQEIADRVGMSKTGLLHHFGTKADLLGAVLEYRDQTGQDRIDNAYADPRGVNILRAMVELVGYNAQRPGLVTLFAVLSGEATNDDHPAHGYFRQRYAFVTGLIRDALVTAAEVGTLRDGVDPTSAARTMVAVMDGLQLQWLLDEQGFDMAAEVRSYAQTLVTEQL